MAYCINNLLGYISRSEPFPSSFSKLLKSLKDITFNRGIYPISYKELIKTLQLEIDYSKDLVKSNSSNEQQSTNYDNYYVSAQLIINIGHLLGTEDIATTPPMVPCNIPFNNIIYLLPKPDLKKDPDMAKVFALLAAKQKNPNYVATNQVGVEQGILKIENFNKMVGVFLTLPALQATALDASQRAILKQYIEDAVISHEAYRYLIAIFTYICEYGVFSYDYKKDCNQIVSNPKIKKEIFEIVTKCVVASNKTANINPDFPDAEQLQEIYLNKLEPKYRNEYFIRLGARDTNIDLINLEMKNQYNNLEDILKQYSKKRKAFIKKSDSLHNTTEDDDRFYNSEYFYDVRRVVETGTSLSKLSIYERAEANLANRQILNDHINMLSDVEKYQIIRHRPKFSTKFKRRLISLKLQHDPTIENFFTKMEELLNLTVYINRAIPNFSASTLRVYTPEITSESQRIPLYNYRQSNEIMALSEFLPNLLPNESSLETNELQNEKEKEDPRLAQYREQFTQIIAQQESKQEQQSSGKKKSELKAQAEKQLPIYLNKRLVDKLKLGITGMLSEAKKQEYSQELLEDGDLYSYDFANSNKFVDPYNVKRYDQVEYELDCCSSPELYPKFHVGSYTWEIATHLYHGYLFFSMDENTLIPSKDFDFYRDFTKFLQDPLLDINRLNLINMYEFVLRQMFSNPNQVEHKKLFEQEIRNYNILRAVHPLPLIFYHSLFLFEQNLENPATHFNNELFYIITLRRIPFALNIYFEQLINKYGNYLINWPQTFFTLVVLGTILLPQKIIKSKNLDPSQELLPRHDIKTYIEILFGKSSRNCLYRVVLLRSLADQIYNKIHNDPKYKDISINFVLNPVGKNARVYVKRTLDQGLNEKKKIIRKTQKTKTKK